MTRRTLDDMMRKALFVALAPGVYTAYNPAVTDLAFYVDQGDTAEGDCTLIKAMFSDRGGACWDGVTAGSAEPR